jgi:hypothetical protein
MTSLTIHVDGHIEIIYPFANPYFTKQNGDIFYRRVTVPSQLTELSNQIRSAYSPLTVSFTATNAFVVTWSLAPLQTAKSLLNTFQVVLVTDELNSFFIANYDRLDYPSADDYPVQYSDNLGNLFPFDGFTNTSNCGIPGRWIFKVNALSMVNEVQRKKIFKNKKKII